MKVNITSFLRIAFLNIQELVHAKTSIGCNSENTSNGIERETEKVEVCNSCRQRIGLDGKCHTEWCSKNIATKTRFVERTKYK